MWVCLKIVYPIVPNGFHDHYPVFKWLFHWENPCVVQRVTPFSFGILSHSTRPLGHRPARAAPSDQKLQLHCWGGKVAPWKMTDLGIFKHQTWGFNHESCGVKYEQHENGWYGNVLGCSNIKDGKHGDTSSCLLISGSGGQLSVCEVDDGSSFGCYSSLAGVAIDALEGSFDALWRYMGIAMSLVLVPMYDAVRTCESSPRTLPITAQKIRLSDTILLADVCVHTEPSIKIRETTGYPGVVIGKVLHRGCLCGRSLGDHRWGLIPWRWVPVANLQDPSSHSSSKGIRTFPEWSTRRAKTWWSGESSASSSVTQDLQGIQDWTRQGS